jgi:hypothetical protein
MSELRASIDRSGRRRIVVEARPASLQASVISNGRLGRVPSWAPMTLKMVLLMSLKVPLAGCCVLCVDGWVGE